MFVFIPFICESIVVNMSGIVCRSAAQMFLRPALFPGYVCSVLFFLSRLRIFTVSIYANTVQDVFHIY